MARVFVTFGTLRAQRNALDALAGGWIARSVPRAAAAQDKALRFRGTHPVRISPPVGPSEVLWCVGEAGCAVAALLRLLRGEALRCCCCCYECYELTSPLRYNIGTPRWFRWVQGIASTCFATLLVVAAYFLILYVRVKVWNGACFACFCVCACLVDDSLSLSLSLKAPRAPTP